MNQWTLFDWLNDSSEDEIAYSEYWNDEEIERSKEWWVDDGNFDSMESYLQRTGLPGDIERCFRELDKKLNHPIGGVGIDLAAGNLWAVVHLLRFTQLDVLYCLEYSRHRLLKLGPRVLAHYSVPTDKVNLVLGSFYNLKLRDGSVDFVFMSQAFHHADKPGALLREVHRVLKPGGVAMIVGEHRIKVVRAYVKHYIKFFVSAFVPLAVQRRLLGRSLGSVSAFVRKEDLFPPDPVLGDHYYSDREYGRMFKMNGFRCVRIRGERAGLQSFLLIRE